MRHLAVGLVSIAICSCSGPVPDPADLPMSEPALRFPPCSKLKVLKYKANLGFGTHVWVTGDSAGYTLFWWDAGSAERPPGPLFGQKFDPFGERLAAPRTLLAKADAVGDCLGTSDGWLVISAEVGVEGNLWSVVKHYTAWRAPVSYDLHEEKNPRARRRESNVSVSMLATPVGEFVAWTDYDDRWPMVTAGVRKIDAAGQPQVVKDLKYLGDRRSGPPSLSWVDGELVFQLSSERHGKPTADLPFRDGTISLKEDQGASQLVFMDERGQTRTLALEFVSPSETPELAASNDRTALVAWSQGPESAATASLAVMGCEE